MQLTHEPGQLVELAAGVDALYLSGQAALPEDFLLRLEAARSAAGDGHRFGPLELGGEVFRVAGHGWGKYRFCLDHEFGRIGVTASERLPTLRVQPRAELLHSIGPAETVGWFDAALDSEVGPIAWTVSRVDVFADWQGLALDRSLSERFVCRSSNRVIYEEDGVCTGFGFGSRNAGTLLARIYDKTIDMEKKGADYWPDVWGEYFDPSKAVHRVEFELGRGALREFGLSTPLEVLEGVGDLWRYGTRDWLTLRTQTADATKSRWPVAAEWAAVQACSLVHRQLGLARIRAGTGKGGSGS